jgi:hypothetical protein
LLISGKWEIGNGELVTHGTADKTQVLHFGDRNWTDYDFKVEMINANEDGDSMSPGLIVLAESERTFWGIALGTFGSHRHFDVIPTVDGDTKWNGGGRSWHPDRLPEEKRVWMMVEAKVRQGKIEAFINGELITTTSNLDITHGCVGLSTYNVGKARWRNIVVTDPEGKVLWEGLPELPKESP